LGFASLLALVATELCGDNREGKRSVLRHEVLISRHAFSFVGHRNSNEAEIISKEMVRFVIDWDNPLRISEERRAVPKALAERPDSETDYSDIPPLTEKFWQNAIRNPCFHKKPKAYRANRQPLH